MRRLQLTRRTWPRLGTLGGRDGATTGSSEPTLVAPRRAASVTGTFLKLVYGNCCELSNRNVGQPKKKLQVLALRLSAH